MKPRRFDALIRTEGADIGVWQVLMAELDSTLDRLRCICFSDMSDGCETQRFNEFWDSLRSEPSVVSINENSDLYEVGEDGVLIALYEDIDRRIIIFDVQDGAKVMARWTSLRA